MASRMPDELTARNLTTTVTTLRAGAFEELDRIMPKTTKECMEHPPLRALRQLVGDSSLSARIEALIIRTNAQMNVAHPMTTPQIIFAADTLIAEYDTETLGDIHLVLQRGAKGYYGSTYHQLDAGVINGWMRKHLEEKAYYRENDNVGGKKAELQVMTPEAREQMYAATRALRASREARQREERTQAIEGEGEFAQIKATYQAATKEALILQAAIRTASVRRYSKLHGGQFKQFFNHEAEPGIRIFAASMEEAREILSEARTAVELLKDKTPKQS